MKHWVFDLDGTLVDTVGHYGIKLAKIFSHFGLEFTEADLVRSKNYFDIRAYFSLYLEEPKVSEACLILQNISIEMAPQVKAFEGIENLLNLLEAKGAHLSIWTGRDLASGKKILEHTGLERFFKSIVTCTCVNKTKPDPEGLLKLLTMTRFKNFETLMIGDHAFDIRGAKSVGVKALSVSWNELGPHPLQAESHHHFSEVSLLHKWAEAL